MNKINVKALALTMGIIWSLILLIMGILSNFGYGKMFVAVMDSIYIGYKNNLIGSLIGTLWGFVDGCIAGAIIALLYNKISHTNLI